MSRDDGPLVLVAPSGTGKTTLAQALTTSHPDLYCFSVSATTRDPRPGEEDGVDYHFLSRQDFEQLVDSGGFAEWAEVHGSLYGTPLKSLAPAALSGRRPVLDIDVQGAQQVLQRIEGTTVIFLLPPNAPTWIERLVGRGTETESEIRVRLETALDELESARLFDEFVVNGDVQETVDEIIRVADGQVPSGLSSLGAEALCASLKEGALAWLRHRDETTGRHRRSE